MLRFSYCACAFLQTDPQRAGVSYDKEFIVCSLDLLSGLAEGLGSSIESLVICFLPLVMRHFQILRVVRTSWLDTILNYNLDVHDTYDECLWFRFLEVIFGTSYFSAVPMKPRMCVKVLWLS